MTKPLVGHATIHLGKEADPLPQWRNALAPATPEAMVKLLVDIASWAHQHPKSEAALTLLGDAYLKIKQPYAAEKAFLAAVSIEPKHAPAREGLGLALLESNRPAEAIKHFSIAHKLDQNNVDILVHLGLALVAVNHLKAAHNCFKLALKRDAKHPHIWLNLGLVSARRGAWDLAVDHFQHAVNLKQDFAEALHNLTLAYRQVGALDQALSTAIKLTESHPKKSAHWILLAELHLNGGQVDLASQSLQRAIEIDPGNPDIYVTQAALYAAERQYQDAEGVLKTALVLSHDRPDIQVEMGHLHLLLGRLDSGWDLYEARRRLDPSPTRRFLLPDWQGEDLSGKTVLVHAEQELGETILFAHCLPDLAKRAEHIVVEVSARLAPLFARSFPTMTVVERSSQPNEGKWLQQFSPAISYQIPFGSLPRYFRKQPTDFSTHSGYLRANPDRVAYWREKLAHLSDRPKIGLAWRGGLLQTGREQRSLPLGQWASVLSEFPVQWISLQYGEAAVHEVEYAAQCGLDLSHWADALQDQDEVAALTCSLDAVVTVCSTQAHLTGALGQFGWVLTPFSPNWCYSSEGDRSLWYPSLGLIRQPTPNDWATPIGMLKHLLALSHLIKVGNSQC